MNATPTLFIVTGAPGSGKTQTCRVLMEQPLEWLFFDTDALLPAVSELTNSTLATDQARWPAYRKLWMQVIDMVADNGRTPVLFLPISPVELPQSFRGRTIVICLLDCPNRIRRKRLQQRHWTAADIQEAISDADELRNQIDMRLDTHELTPRQVAAALIAWLRANQ